MLLHEVIRLEDVVQRQADELAALRVKVECANEFKSEWLKTLSVKQQTPKKSESGAGRKPLLTRESHEDIMCRRRGGESYRQIAKSLGISVGLVGKACNMSETAVEQLKYEIEPVHISNL